jgi:hypothetical protein
MHSAHTRAIAVAAAVLMVISLEQQRNMQRSGGRGTKRAFG